MSSSLIDLEFPWQQQPQDAPRIDWNHPLTRKLVFCAIPMGTTWLDAVGGQVASACSASVPARARNAVDGNMAGAVSLIGATGSEPALFANRTGADAIIGAHSFFIEGSLEGNTVTRAMFGSSESVAGNGFRIDFDDTSSVTNGIRYWANNSIRSASNFDALGSNSELFTHRVLITNDGINSRYYTKRALNTTTASTSMPLTSASRRTRIHGTYAAGSSVGCSAALIAAWDRVLTLEEYQQLHDNPWVLFEPQRIQVVATSSAAVKGPLIGGRHLIGPGPILGGRLAA
jgi:hypothetical protein